LAICLTMQPPLALQRPAFLQSAPIEAGDVWRRVSRGPKFKRAAVLQAITAGGLHILIGWLMYSCWGSCAVPPPGERDACFVLPGHEASSVGVSLIHEVFIDSACTAFVICSLHWPMRFRDVRLGIVPYVSPDAYPRGCVLTMLFPNWCDCIDGEPPTRGDWAAHLRTLVALSLVWGTLWGAFTALLLLLPSLLSATAHEFCMSPWTYILVRAAWTDIEVVLVSMGSFVLWCSRAAEPRQSERGSQILAVASAAQPATKLREPLAPLSPNANFVSVN